MTTTSEGGGNPSTSWTSGALRSVIMMNGIASIFLAFRDRTTTITIPRTLAAAPTAKVRSIRLPRNVLEAASSAAVIDVSQVVRPSVAATAAATAAEETVGKAATTDEITVVVDLGEPKKNPASYGAVFASEPDDGPCWHCRREVKKETKVGIPLRIRDDRFHHLLIVDIEGRACNINCAYKFIKDHASEHSCYEGRETAIQQINEICSPGIKLIAAPDWRLHKINGGPFTDEQFDRETQVFVPTSNLQFRLCSLTFGPA